MSALTQVKERYSMQVRNGISPTNPTKLSITENGEFKNSSCWRALWIDRLWEETEGNFPTLQSPALYPNPPGLQNVATSKALWQETLEWRKEPCLSGHKAKTSKVDALPSCLYVHRELSPGPCTENTTVIYQKEVNNVDYLFNYCYFYYCFPLCWKHCSC